MLDCRAVPAMKSLRIAVAMITDTVVGTVDKPRTSRRQVATRDCKSPDEQTNHWKIRRWILHGSRDLHGSLMARVAWYDARIIGSQ